jgi:translocation and assembly module TamA
LAQTLRAALLIAAALAAAGFGLPADARSARARAQAAEGDSSARPVSAGTGLASVELEGLRGKQADNVRAQVGLFTLEQSRRAAVSPGRLAFLLRRAPAEVQRALQPFGYYTPSVEVLVEETAAGARVRLLVSRGTPVRVRASSIASEGEAADDPIVQEALAEFRPRLDQILNHGRYESSKAAVARALAARGYFDARLPEARVEVLRADSRAEIKLRWQSGARYRFGEARISGSPLADGMAERWLNFEPGEPFEQERLLQLHRRLTELDYFGFIDIRPDPQADSGTAPIEISVVPAKRSIYTAGVSFGTDSGAGLKLGLERRWVNARGHKFSSELDVAQRRSALSALYRIPAFTPIDGWYQLGASYRDDQSDTVDSEIAELAAVRSGRLGNWTLELGLHALRERYRIGSERSLETAGLSTLVYPAVSARYQKFDAPLYSSRGFSFGVALKTGAQAMGSDTDFAQLLVEGRWLRAFGERNRVLLRGQLGRTVADDFLRLPSSLRFFAGGDRSVRGYGYQEISPVSAAGNPIGGRNLLVGSVEYERMFTDTWGAAVFVDAGNAFNSVSEGLRKGVGLGLRWRSPVGPVNIDVARGLDEPRDGLQLHLSLGVEL